MPKPAPIRPRTPAPPSAVPAPEPEESPTYPIFLDGDAGGFTLPKAVAYIPGAAPEREPTEPTLARYLVAHEQLGILRRGQVVTEADLAVGDIERLVRLGALVPMGD